MTSTLLTASSRTPDQPAAPRILLYSDNRDTRAEVLAAVGQRVGPRGVPVRWTEAASPAAALAEAATLDYALVVADAEAGKLGGIGLARQLEQELAAAPPILILAARAQDAWLGSWSGAVEAILLPADPFELGAAVARLLGVDA
ncbi:MAG: hypothetical protein LBT54_04640 [Bifidobacteriaceae bacterium]|jgi:DNA-binding response OmpR family regulator|nr:hypothetical protein [Bifidobacteriaceae bacterium]